MTYKNVNAYRTAYQTLGKEDQLIMLYDNAISALEQAKTAMENKDINEKANKIQKVYMIISGLRDCLDFENGGEVAETLKSWYSDTTMRIFTADKNNDTDLCQICIETITDMRNAFQDAITESKTAGKTPAMPSEISENTTTTQDPLNTANQLADFNAANLANLNLSI